ncbi:hypothetical protein VPHK449_0082 [Vibrio phage K449]
MGLVKSDKTVEKTEAVETVETNQVAETVTQEVSTDDVNAAIAQAQEAEQEAETVVEKEPEVEQAKEPEQEPVAETEPEQAKEPVKVETAVEPEAEKAEETVVESPKVEKKKETEMPIETKNDVVEDAEIVEQAEKVETETAEQTEKVEQKAEVVEKSETKSELVVADEKAGTAVTAPKSKEAAAGQVIAAASDAGFEGLELGFGSFAMIKLENEGQFADSDDNELGKHIRAVLQQSTAVYLYKQEDNDDGPIAYSYDRVNLTSYKGSEGDSFKTVDEVRAAWTEEGYDLEEKKYLEVVATIEEDHDEILEGEVPEGLLDLEGETVMFRLAPASLKAFSGKVATLQMRKQPIQGAVMDFLVGKKRKTNNGKTYFPWKFRLVK